MSTQEQILGDLYRYICSWIKSHGSEYPCRYCAETTFTFDITSTSFVISSWNYPNINHPTMAQLQILTNTQIITDAQIAKLNSHPTLKILKSIVNLGLAKLGTSITDQEIITLVSHILDTPDPAFWYL